MSARGQVNGQTWERHGSAPDDLSPPETWREPVHHVRATLSSPWYHLVAQLSAAALKQTWEFFTDRGLTPVLCPMATNEISSPMGRGSDSLPVAVDLLGQRTHLADSMQFQLEHMLRLHPEGVWYVMPSFRGERDDPRHLNQFFHVEAEILGGLDDVVALASTLVQSLARAMYAVLTAERTGDHAHVAALAERTPEAIRFDDAVGLLGADPSMVRSADGVALGLTPLAEAELARQAGGAVWVTHPPLDGVPFYQAAAPDGSSALAADLLLSHGEVVGAGERHRTGAAVRRSMRRAEVDPSTYGCYLELKDLAPRRTGGFGLGLERLLAWALGHDDIRDIPLAAPLRHATHTV